MDKAAVTSVQNPSWRHHHAPQFYLAKWLDPLTRTLWHTHRIPNGKLVERPTGTRSTGFEPHLYTTPPTTPWEKWQPDIVESSFMSPLDNAASLVHDQLLSIPAGVVEMNESDRWAWARFLRSLMERHPQMLAEQDAQARLIAEELVADFRIRFNNPRAAHALDNFDHHAAATNMVRTHMVQRIDTPEFLASLVKQEWVVVDASEVDFITSDRPLLENPCDPQNTNKTVYAMTLPLSPRRLFASYPRSWSPDPDWRATLNVITSEIHNLLVVSAGRQSLYSTKQIENGQSAKLRTMVESSFGFHGAPLG